MDDHARPMSDADTTAPAATTDLKAVAAPLKDATAGFSADAKAAVGEKAAGASDGIKQGAQQLTEKATEQARGLVDQGRERATGALDQLTQMLNDAAAQVDEKLGEQYGQYARQAAGTVSGFAEQVRAKDTDELFEDARALVRKSPAVAVGAAAALGFVFVRLLSSGLDQRGA